MYCQSLVGLTVHVQHAVLVGVVGQRIATTVGVVNSRCKIQRERFKERMKVVAAQSSSRKIKDEG